MAEVMKLQRSKVSGWSSEDELNISRKREATEEWLKNHPVPLEDEDEEDQED